MIFQFHPDFPDATNEQKWDQIRIWRNAELSMTDWTQLPDSPVDKEKWSQYRQELRDITLQNEKAEKVKFPNRPS